MATFRTRTGQLGGPILAWSQTELAWLEPEKSFTASQLKKGLGISGATWQKWLLLDQRTPPFPLPTGVSTAHYTEREWLCPYAQRPHRTWTGRVVLDWLRLVGRLKQGN